MTLILIIFNLPHNVCSDLGHDLETEPHAASQDRSQQKTHKSSPLEENARQYLTIIMMNVKAVIQSLAYERKASSEELEHSGQWDHGIEPDVLHAGQERQHKPKDAIDRMASESIRQRVEKAIHELDEKILKEGSQSHLSEYEDPPAVAYALDRTP
jgi:hypothetical protein